MSRQSAPRILRFLFNILSALLAFLFLSPQPIASGWSHTCSLAADRRDHAATPLPNTKVPVARGAGSSDNPMSAGLRDTNISPWTWLGPEGGRIQFLAIDPKAPQILYAGTTSGVFTSKDGGETWTAIRLAVNVLVIDPADTQTLYAGTMSGVLKSRDGGASWSDTGALPPTGKFGTPQVYVLAVDPASPQTLYAGVDIINGWGNGGPFKSTNGGDTWSLINTGLPSTANLHFSALAIDPKNTRTLYVQFNGRMFKSINGGENWSAIDTGLPGTFTFAIDPINPETIYAGHVSGGVLKSTDGGDHWSAINTGLTGNQVFAIAVDPAYPQTLYAGTEVGVFKSTNGGGIWSAMNAGLTSHHVFAIAVDPAYPQTLYAGTRLGVFKSVNGGGIWSAMNAGLTSNQVLAVAVDPVKPQTLYAGAGSGAVLKSTDGGSNWIDTGPIHMNAVFSLAIDPTNPQTLYAGTGGPPTGGGTAGLPFVWPGGAIFKSTNGGGSWAAVIRFNPWLSDFTVYALAIDPATPQTLYAGTGVGLYKSTDGGAHWSAAWVTYTNTVTAIAIDPAVPQTLYAGTNRGVFKSTNGGGDWNAVNNGLTDTNVRALAMDPTAGQMLYAGTNGGVFKSTNGGGNWSAVNNGLTNTDVHALAMDPAASQPLYAGTSSGGVFTTTDGGVHWSDTGLTSTHTVNALAIDPTSPQTLYAGTDSEGVWRLIGPGKPSMILTLSAGGAAAAATMGSSGLTRAGYAVVDVNSGSAPYGIAVYSYRPNGTVISECGIPSSPPTTSARIFVDWRIGAAIPGSSGKVTIDTGLALINRGAAKATITFTLRQLDGQVLSVGTGSLAKGEHIARYLWQLPEIVSGFSIPPSFAAETLFGTLEMASDQPLSVVALRLTTNQRGEMLMTSTPTADLTRALSTAPVYFPQLADGGGYTTTIMLLNTSSIVETGRLRIYGNDGLPLPVHQVGGSYGSIFAYWMMPGGAYVFQTDAAPTNFNVGWVELTPDSGTPAPMGAGLYQSSQNGVLVAESGVAAAVPTTHARIFVDTSGGHNSSVALGNPGYAAARIALTALQMDGFTPAGTSPGLMTLDGKGHTADFVWQHISGLPAGFRGILDIASDTPFVPLTIRALVNERGDFLFTAFPVADMNQPTPLPIQFPQIADGGGYTTEFILLSAGSSGAVTLSFFGNAGTPLAVGK